jgi:hypothetical protein
MDIQTTLSQEILLHSAHRLAILVPAGDLDEAQFAHRLWRLIEPTAHKVLLLAVGISSDERLAMERRMVTLHGMIHDRRMHIETQIVTSSNWARALRRLSQPGDVFICLADHTVSWYWRPRKLSQVLKALDLPVLVLPDQLLARSYSLTPRLNSMLRIAVSLAIIPLFSYLQIRIGQGLHGWVSSVLLLGTVAVEAGLLWMWNKSTI